MLLSRSADPNYDDEDFEPIMEQQIHQDDFGKSKYNFSETFCDFLVDW